MRTIALFDFVMMLDLDMDYLHLHFRDRLASARVCTQTFPSRCWLHHGNLFISTDCHLIRGISLGWVMCDSQIYRFIKSLRNKRVIKVAPPKQECWKDFQESRDNPITFPVFGNEKFIANLISRQLFCWCKFFKPKRPKVFRFTNVVPSN